MGVNYSVYNRCYCNKYRSIKGVIYLIPFIYVTISFSKLLVVIFNSHCLTDTGYGLWRSLRFFFSGRKKFFFSKCAVSKSVYNDNNVHDLYWNSPYRNRNLPYSYLQYSEKYVK